jgi:hypothetical protein
MLSKATGQTAHVYGETRYAARSWAHKRRVIIKAEVVRHPGRDPKNNPRFVVTNLSAPPEAVYHIYCGRGDVENWLKELHHGLELDRTSCPRTCCSRSCGGGPPARSARRRRSRRCASGCSSSPCGSSARRAGSSCTCRRRSPGCRPGGGSPAPSPPPADRTGHPRLPSPSRRSVATEALVRSDRLRVACPVSRGVGAVVAPSTCRAPSTRS